MTRLFTKKPAPAKPAHAPVPSSATARSAASPTLPPIVRPEPAAAATRENIEKRAYYLFLARTGMGLAGTPESDWAKAEAELRAS